jgi:mRNA interferase RelE/StbE
VTYSVLVSRTFQKQFHGLDSAMKDRIRSALALLGEDPYTPRSGADIKALVHTLPKKYRLRVGDYRVIYAVGEETVKVIEVFRREKGY